MSRPRPISTAIALKGACGVLVGWVLWSHVQALLDAGATDFDDAYMYLRYAQHWLAGHGLAWNAGEGPVYGVTSLLHFFAVVAVRWLAPRLADWQVLQVASGTAALGLLVSLVVAVTPWLRSFGQHRWWMAAALLVPLVCCNDVFFFHAHSGMDTLLAAASNVLMLGLTFRFANQPRTALALLTALAGWLAVQARPDNLVLAGLCPLLALLLLAPSPRRRPLLIWGVTLALLMAADLLLKWRWLGSPLPLSFYAKRPGYYGGFAGEFTWNPFLFLDVALGSVWPALLAVLLFAGRASLRPLLVVLIPAAASTLAFFGVNQIMGHLGRFYYPSLPLLMVAGVMATDQWLMELRTASRDRAASLAGRFLLRLGLAGLVLLGGSRALHWAGERYQVQAHGQRLAPLGGYVVPATQDLPEMDSWRASEEISALAAAAPAGTRMAMSEHGLVGARASQVAIIDVLGLHDRFFAQRGFSVAELMRRKPDLIWLPHPDHTQMLRDILDHDDFWQGYDFYPDAFTYGLALRRDSAQFSQLQSLVDQRWEACYPGLARQRYLARREPR